MNKKLMIVAFGLAVQAAVLVVLNGFIPKMTYGMDLMWVSFQAWAVYFLMGATPVGGIKAWAGYLLGILASVLIIKLAGAPMLKDLPAGQVNMALVVAVFIIVIPAVLTQAINKDVLCPLFIGSGAFFATLNHGTVSTLLSGKNTFFCAGQAELTYCAVGLLFGWISIFWMTKFNLNDAK